jgi:NADPH:quinone reductase-like Zn-dependent oxidoreductase
MKRRYKLLGWIAGLIGITFVTLGLVLSHESPCSTAPALGSGSSTMRGWVHRCYGGPEVMRLEAFEKPVAADDELVVKVRAAALNPLDWHYMRGEPYIMRLGVGIGAPTDRQLGVDFAGVVESVGKAVTRFKPGDEVLGGADGALSEYVRVRESSSVVLKPANISFEQAAAAPIAAITALQSLRDTGQLKAGQKVLINGASGGVGTFAVQLAKSMGAEVTGVCSTRNVEMVRSIGADHVIDYTKENFTEGTERYDLIIDNVGSHSLPDYRRVLKPDGIFVIVGGPSDGKFLGPLNGVIKAMLYAPFVSQRFEKILASLAPEDLKLVSDLMAAGKVTPVIDRTYPLSEVPEAIGYLETGRARGKVIIKIE